jgi:hypothetical protein|eukprot:COSAG06_NODE_415_length_15998_cov_3.107428_4_plen_34_part_00
MQVLNAHNVHLYSYKTENDGYANPDGTHIPQVS